MEWSERKTVKKGDLGESIVRRVLENKNYIIYNPTTPGPHAFDILAVKNKIDFIVAEVKSKARMNRFRATGIDVRHYNDYVKVLEKYGIDVILFFVDEHPEEKRVYCASLNKLKIDKEIEGKIYPNFDILKSHNIVLFHLSEMTHIEYLEDAEVLELQKLSTRQHEYESN